MVSPSGALSIIGIRAVIIDVRQYLADGREIERTNDRIALANKRVETASTTAANAQKASFAAQKKASADFAAASAARQKLIQAEIALQANAAKIAVKPAAASGLVGAAGQPISSATTASNLAAIAQQTKLKDEVKKAKQEFNDLARVAIIAGRAEKTAAREAIIDIERQNAALADQARLNAQVAAAQRSRIRAAASAGAIVGTAVIGGTAAAAISSAAKYQQELSKINVLTAATDKETQQLGERFKTLSTQIPVSAGDLAAGAYLALSSGIKDVGEAYRLTEVAAKAAAAGQADIKSIVSAVTTVLNDYPKGTINATQATEILFATVREGKGEFNDLANSIGRVIPSAVALGITFDQVGAAMAVMTNGGLNAEEAATALRAILQDLSKNDTSTQTVQALNAIGLSSEQLRQNIKDKGLPQALAELFDLFDKNLVAIEPIIPNVRALTGAFIAFGDSGKKVSEAQEAINKSVGIVDTSFEKTRNNVANLSKLFSNQLNVALIEIGTAILPSVTRSLQELIGWLQNNRQEIQTFVAQGLQGIIDIGREVAKGIKLISTVLGELLGIISSIIGQSNATKLALAAIGTGLAFALPGGPVIVGLTAILILLGQIQDLANGKQDNALGRGIIKGASAIAGAAVGTVVTGNPLVGGLGGAAVGLSASSFIEDLIFGKSAPKNSATKDIADQIAKANKAFDELGNQTLPKFDANIAGINKNAKETAETLKKLAQEFLSTSEAAGQVTSITEEFKKFGAISKELADAAGLSAAQSGQVQGLDAVINAQKRSEAEAFNYVQAINAVSGAYKRSAQVGRELLFQLAQASLEASQTALSNVFSRPTREVADLGVPLARQQLQTAQFTQRNTPAINSLKQQLSAIDKQIANQNKANQAANKAAQRQREQQQKAQEAAQKNQERARQAEADARKIANLIAQQAAERQLALLQKLIDANTKAASDLQEKFLKSNEALQLQINTAIGKGDTKGALGLVEQQREATKQYREQSKALQKSNEGLTTQQKQAQEAEQERQRQQQLSDALFEAQQKQTESIDTNTTSTDTNTDAQDAQTEALENSKQAIQDQIDALQAPIDASQQQEQAIQNNIAVLEAQTAILKAQGVAADKTLLTQTQQREAAEHFTAQIAYASGQAQILAKSFYDFIPGAKETDLTFKTLKGAVDAVNLSVQPGLLDNFDAVKARLDLLKIATEDITTTFNNSATQTAQNAQTVQQTTQQAISDWQTAQEQILVAESSFNTRISSNTTVLNKAFTFLTDTIRSSATSVGNSLIKSIGGLLSKKFATGGIVTRPTLGLIGEAGPEAVLPLNDVARTKQIIGQIVGSSYGIAGESADVGGKVNGVIGIGSGGSGSVSASVASLGKSIEEINQRAFEQYFGKVGANGITGVGSGGSSGGSVSVAAKSIIAQISPAITAAMSLGSQSAPIFAPNITVTGQTLDTMEATAIRAVQAAFRDARTISNRSGGLISQGIGPSR